MAGDRPERVLAAIERNRGRLWAICYRMTGSRASADDLSQDSIARAIERAEQATDRDPTGWLVRIATRRCLDHLRRKTVERRVTELVDPLESPQWSAGGEPSPEEAILLREDLRFAIVVALQALSPRQRAAVILRDVVELSIRELAQVLDTTEGATKSLLHRGRAALRAARGHVDVDVPVDEGVVRSFAAAIESGDLDALTALLADDVWGIVDGGGVIQAASKPTYGRRVVSRQWANARRRFGDTRIAAGVRVLNGEPALVLRLADRPEVIVAVVHIETRARLVVALRVQRDPARFACLDAPGARTARAAD
jgi:RNA polymerase sigma-70 factor (ECF subfamily)